MINTNEVCIVVKPRVSKKNLACFANLAVSRPPSFFAQWKTCDSSATQAPLKCRSQQEGDGGHAWEARRSWLRRDCFSDSDFSTCETRITGTSERMHHLEPLIPAPKRMLLWSRTCDPLQCFQRCTSGTFVAWEPFWEEQLNDVSWHPFALTPDGPKRTPKSWRVAPHGTKHNPARGDDSIACASVAVSNPQPPI